MYPGVGVRLFKDGQQEGGRNGALDANPRATGKAADAVDFKIGGDGALEALDAVFPEGNGD